MTQSTDPTPAPEAPRSDLGHWFTLREAADSCGVSHSTIVRRHRAGAFPNARKDETANTWRVPLADLLAADLTPGKVTAPSHDPSQDTPRTQATDPTPAPTPPVVLDLRDYTALVEKAAQADALAAMVSNQQRTIEELTTVVGRLAITGPSPSTDPTQEPAPAAQAPASIDLRATEPRTSASGDRRRWWKRKER